MAAGDDMRDERHEILELERSVHGAAARLHELRALNRDLRRQVRELEQRLETSGHPVADAAHAAGAAHAADTAHADTAPDPERVELRRRVEALAARLEDLLQV